MGEHLFSARNCKIEVTNTELTNAGGGVVVLIGGNYCFVHCTLANFMTLEKRTTPCLTMANNANEEAYPLKATFRQLHHRTAVSMLAKKHIKENSIYPSMVRHHSNTCSTIA